MVADIFIEHFASVFRKDLDFRMAHHHRYLEFRGVNFASARGESYI